MSTVVAPAPIVFAELHNLEQAVEALVLLVATEVKSGKAGLPIASIVLDAVSKIIINPAVMATVANVKDLGSDFKAIDTAELVNMIVTLISSVPKYLAAFKS